MASLKSLPIEAGVFEYILMAINETSSIPIVAESIRNVSLEERGISIIVNDGDSHSGFTDSLF